MAIGNNYSPEAQERAASLVGEQRSEHNSQWATDKLHHVQDRDNVNTFSNIFKCA